MSLLFYSNILQLRHFKEGEIIFLKVKPLSWRAFLAQLFDITFEIQLIIIATIIVFRFFRFSVYIIAF